ncbi:MAG TPA: mannonate dehydratase [Rectinemataceae bacterium]|nr:mannonate dehydratase [Rectinemataceae bacterium]
MYLTFRWYGRQDPVRLAQIRQIPGVRGIVAALYDYKPGEAWPVAEVASLKREIVSAGLDFSVVESIPIHEEIKMGGPDRDYYIESWISSLRAVGAAGIPVVTYNFMPVFDWTRSDLGRVLPDGSRALAYDEAAIERMDPLEGELELPGWLAHYSRADLARLMARYREIGAEQLWSNLSYFLEAVVPVAQSEGVRLAIHPDDPPWPVFGLPRIVVDSASLRRLISVVRSPANGICLCSGSFGVLAGNDIPSMVREFADNISFAHIRNVLITGPRSFRESAHWTAAGSLDIRAIVQAYAEIGFEGPVRPDHGRMIWGEEGRPGYGLYDRALGSQYILGLMDASG